MPAQDSAPDAATDDDVKALDRLEHALARIEARSAARPAVAPEAMARLDAVIARLRAGLEG